MRPQNHDKRFDGIPKNKLQAFEPSNPKSWQSQSRLHSEKSTLDQGLQWFFTDDFIELHSRTKVFARDAGARRGSLALRPVRARD
jgi:hypothetical protein